MNIAAALARARAFLHRKGIEAAALEAEVLLAHVLGTDRVGLYREAHRTLTREERVRFEEMLSRRAAGEPVAYLTGHREFMGLDFLVTRDVLIPRPETELLVEMALEILGRGDVPGEPLLADVGTGSGAIAVSLARYLARGTVYATDISPAALAVAAENARRHGVTGRIVFLSGDLLAPVREILPPGSLVLVAANLPYIPSADIGRLMPDVACYEPHLALDGGADGLELYRRLVPQARELLVPGGHLLMEISPGQVSLLGPLFPPDTWQYRVHRDLAGRERLVVARKKAPFQGRAVHTVKRPVKKISRPLVTVSQRQLRCPSMFWARWESLTNNNPTPTRASAPPRPKASTRPSPTRGVPLPMERSITVRAPGQGKSPFVIPTSNTPQRSRPTPAPAGRCTL